MHANRRKGHIFYLSKTICEEVVKILGKAAGDIIVSELKEAKYTFPYHYIQPRTLLTPTSFVSL